LVAQGIGVGLKVVAQTALIQRHSAAPIPHNFMGLITDLDHFAVGADPDITT
jgi:beta-galactosidase